MVQLLSILAKRLMKSPVKILIVSANQLTAPYPVYPLGVAYIETYLKENLDGCEIHTFDFNLRSDEDFIAELHAFEPRYVAVSIRNIDGVNSYDPVNFIGGYKRIDRKSVV